MDGCHGPVGYDVFSKHILRQWVNHRQKGHFVAIMADHRLLSKVGEVQPDVSGAYYALARPWSRIAIDQRTIDTAAAR